ncbi:DASS family sodium-coupled anion symporter [Marinobacter sp. M216]|uniref:DASS family sodium-coupled anion symporter n=1 Tax=Marinobacter albus TaxID=3030833 RepID=A0ABT7HBX3_9GAMM|nr:MULTISPECIES: DASS family sodium-coupled anion symporter [unclassified Marinobacter]MBW7470204.1 DASS family sodium-coupled anion symporter [Marinobacter sp. F4218]MDK9557532.1 DASS family sodium-coupled anion symporter [Marinobacter sp. M216]
MTDATDSTKGAPGLPKIQLIGLALGALFLIATQLLPPPQTMGPDAWAALGLMLLMATWWSTEAIPIPATALLPIVLVPALGLGSISEATSPYAHPIIFLFLGGFTLGLAMQRWNLHRRIALLTLKAMGDEPRRQIGGFMLATAFLSMWVSNTATSIMMLPIGLSVIAMMDTDNPDGVRRYAIALLLAIAYSASIGGIATLIGTPPNALLAAYLSESQGVSVGFAQWMLLGVPITVVMLMVAWWWLTRRDFGIGRKGDSGRMIRDELAALGPLTKGEKLVGLVFVVTASAWIFRPLLSHGLMPWLSDTGIAIAAAVVMFILPVDSRRRVFVLDWDTARGIPWGVLLLFGGGLAMAGVIGSSGLAQWIAGSLGVAGVLPPVVIIALVVGVIIFLTEVTSNTATAAAFLPLLGALAVSQGVSPLLLTVPAAVAASCAFMMPVATPPNAIVFSSGHLKIGDMISAGFVLNLIGVGVVTVLCYVLLGFVFTS